MNLLANLCFAAACLLALLAVLYQRRDLAPGHGGSMGGEMTAGVIWLAVALLSALGSLVLVHWLVSILIFFAVLALSFLIRTLIARLDVG
jgi:hypothetical protein